MSVNVTVDICYKNIPVISKEYTGYKNIPVISKEYTGYKNMPVIRIYRL